MSEKKTKTTYSSLTGYHRAVPIILGAVAAFIALCFITQDIGALGHAISGVLTGLFSWGAYAIPVLIAVHAIFYPSDLGGKRILSRVIFSLVTVVALSALAHTVSYWQNSEVVFNLGEFYRNGQNAIGGGFIGSLVGYGIIKVFGSVGLIIIAVAVFAIYVSYFFAGGQNGMSKVLYTILKGIVYLGDFIERKIKGAISKSKESKAEKKKLAEDEKNRELMDDEFFDVDNGLEHLEITELGIVETRARESIESSPTLHDKVHHKSEATPEEAEEMERRRREREAEEAHYAAEDEEPTVVTARKMTDPSYGFTEVDEWEEIPSKPKEEPHVEEAPKKYDTSLLSESSADSVFTGDFDPFRLAMSEELANKPSSRSLLDERPTVTESISEITEEDVERARRNAEFERRRAELTAKKPEPAPVETAPTPVEAADVPDTDPARKEPEAAVPVVKEEAAEPAMERTAEPDEHTASIKIEKPVYNPIRTEEPPRPVVSVIIEEVEPPYESLDVEDGLEPDESYSEIPAHIEFEYGDVSADSSTSPAYEYEDPYAYSADVTEPADEVAPTYTDGYYVSDSYGRERSTSESTYRRAAGFAAATVEPIRSEKKPVQPSYPTNTEVKATAYAPTSEDRAPKYEEKPYQPTPRYEEKTYEPAPRYEEKTYEPTPRYEEKTYEPTPRYEEKTYEPAPRYEEKPYEPAPKYDERPYYAAASGGASASYTEKNSAYTPVSENIPNEPIRESENKIYEFEPSYGDSTYESGSVTEVPETSGSYTTENDSAPESVPEFKPYSSPAEDDGAGLVFELDFSKKPSMAEEPKTLVTETTVLGVENMPEDGEPVPEEGEETVYTKDEIGYESDEDVAADEDVATDEDIADGEREDGMWSDEEIPPEKRNPDVSAMRDMFPALRENEDEYTEDDGEENDEYVGESEEGESDSAEPEYAEAEPDESEFDEAETDFAEDEDDAPPFDAPKPVKAKAEKGPEKAPEKPKPDYSKYQFPPIELLGLEKEQDDELIAAEIKENTNIIIETLASFNVVASIKGVDRGPRITRYEVVPARGVKVNQITHLFDDITLNLAADGVRMEAPIPGKSAIGFEIPNKNPTNVSLRELLECEEFINAKSNTFVCIGKDVAGNPVFGDIGKFPHALVAGATGMGKSVCINSIMISMLYKARPDQVKFIMIDPKKVEFRMYSGIPHLLIPVITEAKQAAGALMWAVEEMERRYDLIEKLNIRTIDAYNERQEKDPSIGEHMPKIIIVIDELNDLMMQVRDPVEDLIMRIAQKARAAGIHLIIGTQRPDVKVITGTIKANINTRISCKVTSVVDSRTILEMAGAEKLLNKGDMLFKPVDKTKPVRVQGAFVSDSEVEAIMNFLKNQDVGAQYDEEIYAEINKAAQKCGNKKGSGAADDDDGDGDDACGYYNDQKFLDAVELAIRSGKISTSLLQRKLSIGYGKAAKYIDAMEEIGVVSEPNGQKPRDVLITMDEWLEKLSRVDVD